MRILYSNLHRLIALKRIGLQNQKHSIKGRGLLSFYPFHLEEFRNMALSWFSLLAEASQVRWHQKLSSSELVRFHWKLSASEGSTNFERKFMDYNLHLRFLDHLRIMKLMIMMIIMIMIRPPFMTFVCSN